MKEIVTIPERMTRPELLRPFFTVPGAKFSIRSSVHAFVICPDELLAEAKACILTAAAIKGFAVTLGESEGGGFLVVTEPRDA